MKKIFASLTIFAAMLAGCQKPELDAPAGVQEAYTATVEAFGAQTKTSLAPNNQIIWTADDRLAVFQASTIADEYKLVEGCEGLTNASFRIVAEDVTLNGDFVAGTEIPCNVAVYPYSENLVLSVVKGEDEKQFNISNIVLPQTQTYAENSFSNGAFMMAAVTETFKDHNLKFKNVMGAVKFQFKGDKTVKTVAIKGNNGELLSGAAVVTVNENNLNPTITMAPDAMTEVVLDCAEGVQLNETEATDFVIALPPVKFEAGFTVTVTDSEGSVNTITSDNPRNAVLRSAILVMPVTTLGEGTVIPEPEPESENWSLIGEFNNWETDLPLEYDGTFYYAKGLDLEGYVKFRRDADWEVNFGSITLDVGTELLPANDIIIPLAHNGVDIYLAKNTYDVYLDLENARAWFMTAGSVPTPVSYEWGVVGEVNGWGENDIPMIATDTKGLFVAKNIEMPDGGFKIRANNAWEYHANYGLIVEGALAPDSFYVVKSGNTGNMLLSAGTYDIWFDLFNAMVYVMSPGKDITDAVLGEPVAPAPGPDPDPNVPVLTGWGISGTNTNNFADGADIMMENDGTWYVAKGVEFVQDDRFKIRKNGSWEESFGFVEYDAEFKVNEEVTLTSENGYDMFPVAGIYDIYFNPETGKTWFINDGSYPTGGTPIPDVPVLTGWGVVGTITGWADGADIMMENDGLWYVAKGVEFGAEDMFKIRQDGKWDVSFGGEFKANEEVILTSINGPDIAAAAGIYDIYFNPETGKAWFINDGSYPVEGEDPVPGPDLPSENITLFFHPNNAWMSGNPIFAAWVWATGSEGAWYDMTDVNSDGIYEVSFPNNCDNIIFASMNGEIDWSNKINQTIDLQLPIHGNTYHVATNAWYVLGEGAPETPDIEPWYIVGNFNGWNPADDAYKMTVEGDCYVYDNFTAAAGCELKFAPGVWSGDKGGNNDFAADTWLNPGGANILVEAGTYKIYLKNDLSQYKFEKK